jgi:hypothetical protein
MDFFDMALRFASMTASEQAAYLAGMQAQKPHSSAGGETAGNSDEERPSVWKGGDGLRPEPELDARVIPFSRRTP